jgi:antirestriction protein ArdC
VRRFTCEHSPSTAPACRERGRARGRSIDLRDGRRLPIGGGEAFYHRGEDFIRVPEQTAFFEPINYYRTCCHELGHWTGHASRLARDLAHRFGSEGYAREELVAEIASAFLCASLAIRPTVRHADYIAEWLKILRNDNRAIFQAASMASKASDFILGFVEAQAQANGASEAA